MQWWKRQAPALQSMHSRKILDKLFRINITGPSWRVVSESAAVETLRKHLLTDVVYNFVDAIKAQANETCGR